MKALTNGSLDSLAVTFKDKPDVNVRFWPNAEMSINDPLRTFGGVLFTS